jgi:alkylation response protein AidB-like acyl-CoA dehydrogenase
MDFELGEELLAFGREVRDWLAVEWPAEKRRGLSGRRHGEADIAEERAFRAKLATKGWLAMALPVEYGGRGLSIWHQYVFAEEMAYASAPFPSTAVGIVAPALIRFGSEEQKRRFLPMITSGEVDFGLGYSEPNAGSDLASLEIRAVRDGDTYVVNGTKMYTSTAHRAEYIWLAARTDPDLPKHRGISLFIVDSRSPGITVRPLWTMGGGRTNQTYWDNVVVPRENLVGEENRGWYYVATALDFERLSVFPVGTLRQAFDLLVGFVRKAKFGDYRPREDPEVIAQIGQLSTELEVAQMLSYRAAWMVASGTVPNREASILKLFGTELLQRITHQATRILGLYGQLVEGSEWAPLQGQFERLYEAAVMPTFGAGSNEIQRNIIATRGLGLPR